MRVDELIKAHGTKITIKTLAQEQPNYDDLRGEWIGEPDFVEKEAFALVRPLHLTEEQLVAGREIREIIEVVTTAQVAKNDRIEVDGRIYKIVEIKRIFDGLKILFTKAVGQYEGED